MNRLEATCSRAARRCALADLRRRWRQLTLLGVMAGVTCGLAFAALDGAARTGTALDRFLDRTSAADAVVFTSQVGALQPDWSRLEARPEVERLGRWYLLFGEIGGQFGGPLFGSTDGVWTSELDRPIVLEGRMFDPTAPDEVVIDDGGIPGQGGYVLGDRIPFRALGSIEEFGGPATGPSVEAEVVGIVKTPWRYLFSGGGIMVSPGFAAAHPEQPGLGENATVKLRPGTTSEQIRGIVNETVAAGTPILDLRGVSRRAATSLAVERAILLALGLAIVAVGAVLVAQAVVRSTADAVSDAPTLRAMGMTNAELAAGPMLSHLLGAAVAVPVAVATALLASLWLPVGFGAQLDPDRGVQAPPLTALLAGLAVGLAVVAVAAVAARAALAGGSGRSGPRSQPTALRRLRPLPVGLGFAMAFESRAGRHSTGARAALIGSIAAVSGVAGTVTLTHAIADAADHPERAGAIMDAFVTPLSFDAPPTAAPDVLLDELRRRPEVAAATLISRQSFDVDGIGVPTFALPDQAGIRPPFAMTMVAGRQPTVDDEIALGPATAKVLDVSIGDTVELADGPARVVGLALFPTDVHSQFDEGALVTWPRSTAIVATLPPEKRSLDAVSVALRLHGGRDQAAIDAIGGSLSGRVDSAELVPAPPEVVNLGQIRTLPLAVAGFLVVLGVAAVGYGLAASVRRRRRDVAVWRALGMTAWNIRATVAAEATMIALVGTVVGAPLGVVIGRLSWKAISDRIPLAFVAPLAAGGLLAVVALAFALANALAVLPGRHAGRLRPAVVLRAE